MNLRAARWMQISPCANRGRNDTLTNPSTDLTHTTWVRLTVVKEERVKRPLILEEKAAPGTGLGTQLGTVRWRTYQIVFVIASVAMVPLILTGRDHNWDTIGLLVLLSIAFALLAIYQGLLRRVSPLVEMVGLGLGLVLYLARYVQVMSGIAAGLYPPEALGDLFPWVGVIIVGCFLVLPFWRALIVAGFTLCFISTFGFSVLPHWGAIRGFEPMFDLTIASLVMIVLLAAYRQMIEAGARAEATAEAMSELAIRDSLTGLYNRRYLDQKLAEEFARAHRYNHPLSVAICDIDFFKSVNDRFSHATGDETLKKIASLLDQHTRQADTVARYGGEEFVIVLTETLRHDAVAVCKNLCRIIERYTWSDLHPDLSITVSIGISDDLNLDSHEKMLHQADKKLYEAKHQGKNQVRV